MSTDFDIVLFAKANSIHHYQWVTVACVGQHGYSVGSMEDSDLRSMKATGYIGMIDERHKLLIRATPVVPIRFAEVNID